MNRTRFRHVFDRHGVWGEVPYSPQFEVGPCANFGWFRFCSWGDVTEAKRGVTGLTKNELRLFVALCYELGRTVTAQREVMRWVAQTRRETEAQKQTNGATASENASGENASN